MHRQLTGWKSFRNYFKDNDWEVVEDPVNADMIIANTCAYDKLHEDTSVQDIEELKNMMPSNMSPHFFSQR